uniref:Uncharacterized protein n=1 Tax=viral metagenome TaxID=1070528 RepID=A0A6C0EJB5_9ZZZZ
MANGFTSPGSFNNNRKASAFFGSPYANTPYYNAIYKTPATQSAAAYALLQNGNGYASRINKYNVVTFALKKLVCEARNIY